MKGLKASNAELMSEMSTLRISLHEREAELAAISRLTERPGTAGKPEYGIMNMELQGVVTSLAELDCHNSVHIVGLGAVDGDGYINHGSPPDLCDT